MHALIKDAPNLMIFLQAQPSDHVDRPIPRSCYFLNTSLLVSLYLDPLFSKERRVVGLFNQYQIKLQTFTIYVKSEDALPITPLDMSEDIQCC